MDSGMGQEDHSDNSDSEESLYEEYDPALFEGDGTNIPKAEEEPSDSAGESDSSEGEKSDDSLGGTLDKCPVCLRVLKTQEIAIPDCCEHVYCLSCIIEWAATSATCPIDRKSFHSVLIMDEVNGRIIRVQELSGQASGRDGEFDDFAADPTYCEVCGNCDREDRLLLCDGCDMGYHLECLEPPLSDVPISDWYCTGCEAARGNEIEAVPGPSASQGSRQVSPRVPRTSLSRRIMIRRRRASPSPPGCTRVSNRVSAISRPRRAHKKPSRRKKRRGRKATSRRVRKRKRLGEDDPNRRRVALQRKPATARGRLVQQLGILPPRPGQVYVGLPQYRPTYTGSTQQSSASTSIRNQRHQAGIAPLRIYGNDDLADCLSSEEDEVVSGSVAVARPAGIIRRLGQPLKRASSTVVREIGPSQLSSSANVLGPILSAQYILHKDKNIHIQRDGTLVPSMSITFDKFGKEINDNDSSGYDSFGQQGSPSISGSGGPGRGIAILTATGGTSNNNNNTGMQVPASESGAGQSESRSSDNTVSTTADSATSLAASSLGINPDASENSNGNSDLNGSNAYENYLFRMDGESEKSGSKKSDSKEAEEEDDDDYNIYSDIEEPHLDPSAEDAEFDTPDPDPDPIIPDAGRDSDSDMVIDEQCAAPIGPRARESISSGESLSIALPPPAAMVNLFDQDRDSENGSPALPEVEPDSPLSIPLPDSTPPPSVSGVEMAEDEDSAGLSDGEDQDMPKKEEYDPSHPLTSSDEETMPLLPKVQSQSPVKQATESNKLDTTTDAETLSMIPIPNEESYRRPTIQFSIPSRHRIFSMGSLIKRNKGVMKKEAKSGTSISFQSEMSKAFGTEGEGGEADGSEQGVESERVSLVAEIFGSDEDEDSRKLPDLPEPTEPVPGGNSVEPSVVVPEPTAEPVSDSSKWKKIVKDDVPSCPIPGLDVPGPSVPVPEIDDDVILIGEEPPEVQIIETPPPELEDESRPPNPRRIVQRNKKAATPNSEENKKTKSGANTVSLDSVSEEDTPEFLSLKRKLEEVRKENSIRTETTKSGTTFNIMEFDTNTPPTKPPKKNKEPKEKKASKRKKSFSGSNCEEGEILEVSEKKRKKGKKSKKSKKSKRNKDSRSRSVTPADFSEKRIPEVAKDVPSSSSSDEDDGEGNKRVPWKKPSKSTKERNYRDGKPKAEEKYFREKEKKPDESPNINIDQRGRDKSPKSKTRDHEKDKRSKNDHSSLSRKHSRSRSRHRTLSRSRGKAKRTRTRSRHSDSSSARSFRSRSRSGFSRSPRSKRERRYGRRSFSPRRVLSRSRSRSRSIRKSYRSKSPAKPRSSRRSRSVSKTRRNKWKNWSESSSRSRSRSTSPRGRKRKDKGGSGVEEKSKKSKKDGKDKDKSVSEKSVVTPATAELSKDKSSDKDKKKKKKRREKSVSPAKAIFADGDSIVVSLNFQSKTKEGDGTGSNGKEANGSGGKNEGESSDKKKKGAKGQGKGTKKNQPLKKTILIDLETSPIQEQNIGVSPTLIVLSDDEDMRDYTSGSSKSKGNSTDRDGVNVSTTSSGNGHESHKSPSYRDGHGVQADSTQLLLQQLYQSEGGGNESSGFFRRTTSSPDKFNNVTPTRGDSLVTSTRDSMEGMTTLHDDYTLSPFTPPKDRDSSPMATTPPLPPGTPPRNEAKNELLSMSMSGPSSGSSIPNPSGLRPLGIGNIPGLFVSSSMLSAQNGGLISSSPVVIPTPPVPQIRLPPPVATNLFNQSVLATVANALYGPLMNTPNRLPIRPNLGGDLSGQSVSSSVPSRSGPSVVPKKYTNVSQLGGAVLLPKDQNSHVLSHGRRPGEVGGDSPFSPNSSDGDDLFEPPTEGQHESQAPGAAGMSKSSVTKDKPSSGPNSAGDGGNSLKGKSKASIFDSLFGGPVKKPLSSHQMSDKNTLKTRGGGGVGRHNKSKGQKKEIQKMTEQELRNTGDVPTSAVDLRVKEKVNSDFLKKLNRQERVVEEVKLSLKPHYIKKHVTKDEYKEILRKAVPKICHNKHGDINPLKIKELIEAYVKKFRHARKK